MVWAQCQIRLDNINMQQYNMYGIKKHTTTNYKLHLKAVVQGGHACAGVRQQQPDVVDALVSLGQFIL